MGMRRMVGVVLFGCLNQELRELFRGSHWSPADWAVRGGVSSRMRRTYSGSSARSDLTVGTNSVGMSIVVFVGSSKAASSSAMDSSSDWDS